MKNSSLTFGFLDWKGERTTKNTLNSYLLNGLFDLADQSIYFGQEGGTLSDSECVKYGFTDRLESDRNIGIANAFIQMIETCNTEYFMFLENDWELICDKQTTKLRINDAKDILDVLEKRGCCVRLRHRIHPGEPLYTRQFQGNELISPKHLIECIHWNLTPHITFKGKIHLFVDDDMPYYSANVEYANYTNNPCCYKTEFIREHIIPRLTSGSNIEDDLNDWWPKSNLGVVVAGNGLFSHNRID